jgi:hypothetical protein
MSRHAPHEWTTAVMVSRQALEAPVSPNREQRRRGVKPAAADPLTVWRLSRIAAVQGGRRSHRLTDVRFRVETLPAFPRHYVLRVRAHCEGAPA